MPILLRIPPLLLPMVSLMAGITLSYVGLSLLLCMLLVAFVFCIGILVRRHYSSFFLTQAALALLAFIIGIFCYLHQQHTHQQFYQETINKIIDARATVTDIAIISDNRFKSIITFSVQAWRERATYQWHKSNSTLQCYLPYLPNVDVGDQVNLYKISLKPIKNDEFRNYLLKEGINNSLFLTNLIHKRYKHPYLSLRRTIHHMRQSMLMALKLKLSPSTFAFVSSVFLGNKQEVKTLMQPIKYQFNYWGVAHILARSGLHLSIIILLWHFLLSMAWLPFFIRRCVGIAFILIYYALSWSGIPFMRSFLTYLLYESCLLLQLQANSLHLFTLVCIIILIHNPIQLFFLDFQLSFGLTYALLWFMQQPIQQHQRKIIAPS